ncbi:gamma-glutamyltranspeptidase [Ophiostoma piceae UAMH 11346]|uniref:Glutathione hydrolase n=1 Tax=Ophiostoma piceae (strain UAMH 11346) TaxID=1262450 RepID=S3C6M4_OPHP1|nr:gamma-glutamyltranspeptidase [Ophiostoma piceae UAMH 11346]
MRSLVSLRGILLLLLACESQLAAAIPPLQKPLLQDNSHESESAESSLKQKYGSHGAVASETAICSNIGVDLMRQGGTAADAMVATTLCVGVIGMYHSGIGGGGFMLVRGPDGSYETVDFRETAPAAAFEDMYEGNLLGSVFGGLAVAVPGELRGLEYLHKKYGALPWKTVVMPAVHVARHGFPISEDHVRYMDSATNSAGNFLTEDPVWAEDFAPHGKRLKLGEIITRKRYADTLETIANEGIGVLYSGSLAKEVVDTIQASNGSITLDDLENFQLVLRPAVNTTFRGRRLFSTGAPSSGAIVLSVLKTMEQFPIVDSDGNSDANLTTHRFDEALRFGYGARSHFGDPSYVKGVFELEASLLSAENAVANSHKIRDDTTLPVKEYNPSGYYAEPGHGTSHVVTSDNSGLAISSTTTINTLFGSTLMTPKSGIILNNQMNDFSIPQAHNEFGYPPSPANFIQPGKRPLSSITPVMAEDLVDDGNGGTVGKLILVTGAAGGSRIISSTAQVAWHVLDHNMSISDALAEPRLHDQLAPNYVSFEAKYDSGIVAGLAERGHNVTWVNNWYSAVQGIHILPNGLFEASGEPRQLNSGGTVF